MKSIYRAFALLEITVPSTANLDGLTHCGETPTVPGLICESTTASFPITSLQICGSRRYRQAPSFASDIADP